jgi:hypothetical protein
MEAKPMIKAMCDDDPDRDVRHRTFVNGLSVSFDISNVDMDFTQHGDIADELRQRMTLTTTPAHFVHFSRTLSQTVARYEQLFGRLPALPDSGLEPEES